MKLLGLVMVFVLSATTEAWAYSLLRGDWQMKSHTCSSGAPIVDQIQLGRDRLQTLFRQNTFTIINNVGTCSSWSSGRYELRDGRVLILNVEQANTNCDPRGLKGTFTYAIDFLDNDHYVVYIGPVDGGACPRGDLIQNVYERIN